MYLIKILFFLIYIFLFLLFSLKDLRFFNLIIKNKIWIFLNKIRFFSNWGLFLGMGPMYLDIRITTVSNKNTYIWYIRETPNIGDIKIKSGSSRLTLCFYYKQYFAFFLNEYFFKKTRDYLFNKNEEMIFFKIDEIWYDSYSKKELYDRSNFLFKWEK